MAIHYTRYTRLSKRAKTRSFPSKAAAENEVGDHFQHSVSGRIRP
jgi:hypothetical protein